MSLLGYFVSHINVSVILPNSLPFRFTSFYGNPKVKLCKFSLDLLRRLISHGLSQKILMRYFILDKKTGRTRNN